jgi:hypothetical protein
VRNTNFAAVIGKQPISHLKDDNEVVVAIIDVTEQETERLKKTE